jgi:type VI protein secretion system component VasK
MLQANAWLLRAAWWHLAVVMGLLLAPFFVLLFRVAGDHSWTAAVVMGIGVAVICAPALVFMTAKGIRDSMVAAERVPAHERAVVERAARRGPVPEDDGQRQAALRLVEDRLLTLQATRTRAVALPTVLALLAGVLAVTRSPWWWVAVAAAVALVVGVLLIPRRLRRRADLLRRRG